jgi:mannosyl-3-phosphoglycerate phosphatase
VKRKLMVFTDLDGTLLDHRSYTYEPAKPALAALKQIGADLVLASSKTAAEIAPLRAEIGFAHCEAIVENGGGILGPYTDSADALPGDDHARLLAVLNGLPQTLRSQFSGFSDWTLEEISRRTGLPVALCALAARRQFTEPGEWRGDDTGFRTFCSLLVEQGVDVTRGGRFATLSFGHSKGDGAKKILREHEGGQSVVSAALGDAPNDISMIEAADFGIIIANPDHAGIPILPGEDCGKIWRSGAVGPRGWNLEVLKLVDMTRCSRAS